MRQYLPFIALLFLISSCKTEINYKGEIIEPLLVVYAEATTNGFVNVKVSESAFFLDKVNLPDSDMIDEQYYRIKDAQVMYSVNGGEPYPLTYNEQSVYSIPDHSTYPRLAANDKVTVTVQHPRFASTKASQIMPPKYEILLTEVHVYAKQDSKGDSIEEYHLTYHVPHIEDDYYVCRINIEDNSLNGLPIMSTDLIFQELNYSADSQNWREILGSMFSFEEDEMEDYRPYLDFRVSDIPEGGKDVVIVFRIYKQYVNGKYEFYLRGVATTNNLYTSESYLYMQSINKYKGSNAGILGLEEKVQVYGNFSDGAIGCLTAKSHDTYMTMFADK